LNDESLYYRPREYRDTGGLSIEAPDTILGAFWVRMFPKLPGVAWLGD